MWQPEFTHINRGLNAPASSGSQYCPSSPGTFGYNGPNNWTDLASQFSIFYGGKVWGNLGMFMQWTYAQDQGGEGVAWDNTDIRYADTMHIGPFDVLWGLDANNNPTVQNPWNTVPAWGLPFISSSFIPGPAAATMLEGSQGWGGGNIVGAGGYVFINDMLYLELTGYGPTSRSFQWAVTGGPPGNPMSGVAPYYRVALEKNWGEHSLEVGAYGMNANVITNGNGALPAGTFGWPTDILTDNAFDLQYQWITDVHAVTLTANYILERQNQDFEPAAGHRRQQCGLSAQPENLGRICLQEHLRLYRNLFQHQRHGGHGALRAQLQLLAQFGRLAFRHFLLAVLARRPVHLALGQCAHRPAIYIVYPVQWRNQQCRSDGFGCGGDQPPVQRRQRHPLLPERQRQQHPAGLRLGDVVIRAAGSFDRVGAARG